MRHLADWNVLPDVGMDMTVAIRIDVHDRDLRDRIAHREILRRPNLDGANISNGARLRFPAVLESEIVEILSLPPIHNTISL